MDKLLILGGNPTEIEIVERAKKLGLYTIVTDNHTDWKLSPAKQLEMKVGTLVGAMLTHWQRNVRKKMSMGLLQVLANLELTI